ncbi:MAG: hypothetical protein ACD_49C00074G0005 [uncultured bacterium (gcode 4)]|uniref:Signal peptidase I n=1 Tax=uncultured bacterium (gcode 4) TaxID=1234023 RepID=K2BAY4_9BACT|nr:MAG: hypothetical protein ACD_49C00074G0005 [uncultured bacterium (gcode 4)]
MIENNNIAETEEKMEELKNVSVHPDELIEEKSEITELKEDEKTWMQEFISFIRDLIIIFVVVMTIRTYLAAPFQISGKSMETSYHDKEFIIVDKFSLVVWTPSRWDVVIFRPHASNGKEFYIKRVIALPGEQIKFQDWEVYINKNIGWTGSFIKLDETYLSALSKWRTFLPSDVQDDTFTVPDKEYFLMWDNRNNSSDSRSCFMSCSIQPSTHFIKESDVLWKVFLDFWYFNIFQEWTLRIWDLKWVYKPRFLDTPRNATYEWL